MVRKNAFMLSSATLMLAKYGDTPVFDLTPEEHGVGLAKEIGVNIDSSNIDLTAGVAQAIVDSQRTNVQVGINGMVQEYSPENLLRAQGLADSAVQAKRGELTAEVTGGGASLTITSDPVPGEPTSAIGDMAAEIPAGSTVLIQHATIPELTFPAVVATDSTYAAEHTIDITGTEIPTGMTFPVGSKVWLVTPMGVGTIDSTDLFAVKIVGTLANFNRPVVFVAPKVQITRGFNLSFTETEYGAMPWEMRPLLLSSSEVSGRLSEIGTRAPGKLYAA